VDKVILVKELKSNQTKGDNPKTYPVIYDQDGDQWHIFNPSCQMELNKVFLMTYKLNEKGFKDIEKITPLVNLFKTKALKEVANRNDLKRDLFMSLSYSKDLLIADKIKPDEIFTKADEIFAWINTQTDKNMPKE
jgi:hypothetical protein